MSRCSTFEASGLSREKAMRLLSGDQAGAPSRLEKLVTRTTPVPSGAMRYRSQKPEREEENRILGPLTAVRNSGPTASTVIEVADDGAELPGVAGSAPAGARGLSPPSQPATARPRARTI